MDSIGLLFESRLRSVLLFECAALLVHFGREDHARIEVDLAFDLACLRKKINFNEKARVGVFG